MDIIDTHTTIRHTYRPADLYAVQCRVSEAKEKGQLTKVEYDELVEHIKARFRELSAVANQLDSKDSS